MFANNQSGLEMALRSMGLGTVLDAAKQLAGSGAVEKILAFAEQAEQMNARLARIEAALGVDDGAAVIIEAVAIELRRDPEPGSGSADRDVA